MEAPARAAFHAPKPTCVHPLLVYADLLVEANERAADAAQKLHSRYLNNFEAGVGRTG
jgi:hypothetical protein